MKFHSKYWLTTLVISIVAVNNIVCDSKRDAKDLTQNILDYVNATALRQFLLDLSLKPHLAGTEQDYALVDYVHNTWVQQGLDVVKNYSYNVLLSYPDWDNPNQVNIVNDVTDEVIFAAAGRAKPLYSPEESDPTAVPNFNAYSRPGKIKGDLVYVHYGHQSDFEWIVEQGIDLKGKIVIARYGAEYRGDIVLLAENYGASGVILYSDPQDFAPNGRNDVYPNSTFLPGTGVQIGTLTIPNGDPLTPNYPAVDGAYRIPIEEAFLPQILVQPISYDDAEEFLKLLGGLSSPPDWVGTLNAAYNIGPGFIDSTLKVELDVRTTDQIRTVTNVIGIIRGSVEPDRYVLLGNHRDAWYFGAMDPSGGTAALLEVTRVLSQLVKEGWQPRRTLVFCSWDAEEYGLVGSQEWVEENLKVIKDRSVAYINVDMPVVGKLTLVAEGLPTLHRVFYEATKKIPNPDPVEVAQGRTTVYDTWIYKNPETDSPIFNDTVPLIYIPGSGSDHGAFLLTGGIPVVDLYYTSEPFGPLYHTLYETFYEIETLVDPGFKIHVAMTQLWAEFARSIVDSVILPLNVEDYGSFLRDAYQDIESIYGQTLTAQNISLSYFAAAIENFAVTATTFQQQLGTIDLANPIAVRAANDQLMQFERAFLQPEGLPGPHKNYLKHVVFSPSSLNQYGGTVFASFTDLIFSATTPEDWQLVEKEISAVVYFIQSATSILLNF